MAKRGPKGPRKHTPAFIDAEADALIKWVDDQGDAPFFLQKFAVLRGYYSEYLAKFAGNNEKFASALKRAKDVQEANLATAMLHAGNAAAYIFALKNVAGWRDKQEVTGNVTFTPIKFGAAVEADGK
jgi:hypothetical protein